MKQIEKKEISSTKRYLKWFWMLFFSGISFVVLIFLCANWGVFGTMPTFDELENPPSSTATEIISADGKVIGKIYLENRTPIKYEDLPQHLVNALIATEDERFYNHSGIDARGTLRAVAGVGSDGGGSTITQQLAKNLFHGSSGSSNKLYRVIQKIKEWIIAVKLEKQYTKEEIITHYLNTVNFVNNAYGIHSASKIYFNKKTKDLTVDEAAILVGMLKGPSKYNPRSNSENSKNRRNVVLSQMHKNGYLSDKELETYQNKPIKLDFTPETHDRGNGTYFREYLRDYLKKWAKENPKNDGTTYDIYRDGLRIYTTIDSRMQEYAEEAVKEHLSVLQKQFFREKRGSKLAPFEKITKKEREEIITRAMKNSFRWKQMLEEGKTEEEIINSFGKKTKMQVFTWKGAKDTVMTPRDSILYYKHFLQTGMMAMEPASGHIKAWVGGIDYRFFQYDHVGQGARQVGSTFKPFVYAAAMQYAEMDPCSIVTDGPFTMPAGRFGIPKAWSPKNSGGKYYGGVNLKFALAQSLNTVTARLMDKVGPQKVVELVQELGVNSKIPESPAIALGAVDITVYDMVGAYSTFANGGNYIKPQFIKKITDRNGKLIYEPKTLKKQALSRETSEMVLKLMEGVTQSGSGARLRRSAYGAFSNPIAGKTGTTQNNSDGWFIGMVPNLATGVWVGNEDRSAHFRSTSQGQGASVALPIWAKFMSKCYKNKELHISKDEFYYSPYTKNKYDCGSVSGIDNDSLINTPDSLPPSALEIINELGF